MFRWLKKLFIPHKHNDYKPHLFRDAGALALFSIIVLLFFVASSGPMILDRINLTALVLPKVLVDYTNENRASENFKNLTISPVLEKAAQLKANDMAEKGYFAHNSPDGNSPWYFFRQAGYDFSYAGENLAVNFTDSVDVSRAWMNSPGHKANIMNGNFTEIGIATAEGVYKGKNTVFVVQLFGRPAAKTTSSTSLKPVTQTTGVVVKNSGTPATTSQVVLSENVSPEILNENGSSELYVSVEKKSSDYPTTTPDIKYSSSIERILMSPNKTLSYAYLIISLIILMGLIFTVFIEIRRQHPRLILLAIGLLVIIVGLLYIYRFILFAPLLIV